MTPSVPTMSLPAVLAARDDQLDERLLVLAIEYADIYRCDGEEQDDSMDWQGRETRLASYGSRACYRPTPLGRFAFTLLGELVERLNGLRAVAPRSVGEWTAELGDAAFDLCAKQDLLLPENTPEMLAAPDVSPAPTELVKTVFAEDRPFRADQFVDSFSEVRARLPRSQANELVDGAVQVMQARWLPERLDQVREHVASAFTGCAVPLGWLLAAPVDHPLVSWRRPPVQEAPSHPPVPGRRLFVPRDRRDNAVVQWWAEPVTLDQWRATQGDGPSTRLGEHLEVPDLDPGGTDPEGLAVEFGWVPSHKVAPLARRRVGGYPWLNLNQPSRPGALGLADLAVTIVDERLQLIHRCDGRHVELRADSPLVFISLRIPWVVQLLGLLIEEARDGPSRFSNPGRCGPARLAHDGRQHRPVPGGHPRPGLSDQPGRAGVPGRQPGHTGTRRPPAHDRGRAGAGHPSHRCRRASRREPVRRNLDATDQDLADRSPYFGHLWNLKREPRAGTLVAMYAMVNRILLDQYRVDAGIMRALLEHA